MVSFVGDKIVEILRKTKFSLQTDESTIYSQAILVVYVRFIYDDDLREEMLFIKSLPETTRGEDIFNHIMQYCRGSWGKTDMWGKTNTNVFYPFRIDKIKNF